MKILLITPYYPYPPEKTGGVHTINYLLGAMKQHIIDILYYGEDKCDEYRFFEWINNVYHVDLRKNGKMTRIQSILCGKTYTAYRYIKNSTFLTNLVNKEEYNLVIYDQYSSMQLGTNKTSNQMLFMHDSMPLLFDRKRQNGNTVEKMYYMMQKKFSVNEERKLYSRYNKIVFVSTRDINEEEIIHKEYKDRFVLCDLGVDMDAVKNTEKKQLPKHSMVFTGVMDYEPNADAMIYFVNNLFDKIVGEVPDTVLYIVGKNPTKEILDFGKRDNIIVTGMVDNVFSYIKGATVYVSPLRIGSGKKNKIIEAMACNTPIVASDVSLDGFEDSVFSCVKNPNNEEEWVNNIVSIMMDEKEQLNMKQKMLGIINESYQWNKIAEKLLKPFSEIE